MSKNMDYLNVFLEGKNISDQEQTQVIETEKDGLIEKKIINKKLVTKDGKELLREERPISHSNKMF
jgi:hypothetical protein